MVASNCTVDSHPEVIDAIGSFDTSESDTEVIDASMHSDSTAESEGDMPLQRTQSQVSKQKQVGAVVEHISERQAAIRDLQRTVSALEEQGLIKEVVATVTAAQKQARNLGEDLMEDMLSLDSLSNLFSEDRAARKKAVFDIESLLTDVDTVKAQLSSFRSRLDAELEKHSVEEDHFDIAAVLAESDTEVIDASMHSDTSSIDISTAESECNIALQRTQSQVSKQKQVGAVIQHISEHQAAIRDLQCTVSALEEQGLIKEVVATVTAAQKQARNLGEDLMEDMLSLDSLSNLFSEDRAARKKAISDVETLLADVDIVKVQLNNFRSRLDAELAKHTVETDQPSLHENRTLMSHGLDSQRNEVHDQDRILYPEQNLFAMPPAPGRTTWEQQHLSLQFHPREERRCYVVEANAPGLDVQDLKLQLAADSSTLIVEGLCLPTAQQKTAMRRIVASKLQDFAQRSPKQFAQMGGAPGMSPEAFAKLSQGSFGRFSQSFSIPCDVAVSHIDASYEDGKLRIVLPKRCVVPSSRPYIRHHPYHAVHDEGLSPWW